MISGYPFEYMQRAVEAAQTSHHPDSKVGSALVINNQIITSPNFWPQAIEQKLGKIDKISNASATIHAETACLLHADFATNGASVFSTDPSCPNCAKNMAEAGIRHLYIDHKGFEKYYAQKRLIDFETITLPICAAAGISVTKIFRKEKRTEEILSAPDTAEPHTYQKLENFSPAQIQEPNPYAAARTDKGFYILTALSPSAGLTYKPDSSESKYNFDMQPLNRLLMIAAREGLKLDPQTVYCSRVPTARELVNAVGAGLTHLIIGHPNEARDSESQEAVKILTQYNIIDIK